MATKIQVGSRVKCIDASGTPLPNKEILPRLGVVYTVRTISTINNTQCYRLKEIVNPPYQYKDGFAECSFRANRFTLQVGKK